MYQNRDVLEDQELTGGHSQYRYRESVIIVSTKENKTFHSFIHSFIIK